MIRGSCHCGEIEWIFQKMPESATACNCTVCRRYGALWGYDYDGESIHVSGPTQAYIRGDSIGFNFCPICGCMAYWRALQSDDQGRWRIAVNLRLAENPEIIEHIPIRHFDGFNKFEERPSDGRCIKDYWF